MALDACDGGPPWFMSWPDGQGGTNDASGYSLTELCGHVDGELVGAGCVFTDSMSGEQVIAAPQQLCWDQFNPDPEIVGKSMCSASSPCNFTLTDAQWSDVNGWAIIGFVVFCFALFCHGFGVGDART